jgi:hypothetical protein
MVRWADAATLPDVFCFATDASEAVGRLKAKPICPPGLPPARSFYELKTDEAGFQCSRPTSDNANRSSASQDTELACRVVSPTAC